METLKLVQTVEYDDHEFVTQQVKIAYPSGEEVDTIEKGDRVRLIMNGVEVDANFYIEGIQPVSYISSTSEVKIGESVDCFILMLEAYRVCAPVGVNTSLWGTHRIPKVELVKRDGRYGDLTVYCEYPDLLIPVLLDMKIEYEDKEE